MGSESDLTPSSHGLLAAAAGKSREAMPDEIAKLVDGLIHERAQFGDWEKVAGWMGNTDFDRVFAWLLEVRSRLQPAAAGEAPISAEAVNTSTTIPIVVRDLQTIASVLRNMPGDGSASQHFGKRVDEAASVIQSLAGALEPFADLADEIEAMAKQDGSDPENWAKACTWHDLIAARSALASLREGG